MNPRTALHPMPLIQAAAVAALWLEAEAAKPEHTIPTGGLSETQRELLAAFRALKQLLPPPPASGAAKKV